MNSERRIKVDMTGFKPVFLCAQREHGV